MAQTESVLRWLSLSLPGRKGERLYPGKADPEQSYRIDCIIEKAMSFLGGPWLAYLQGPVNDLKARELSNTIWVTMLKEIDTALSKNSDPNFLVGSSLSLADLAWGGYLLKNALS